MKIFEIKNIDCSKKEHRQKLVKETMKVCKLEEKPKIYQLKKKKKKIKKKYGMKLRTFPKDKINFKTNMASVEIDQGQFSTFDYDSKYECLCKYILIVKCWVDFKKLEAK